MKLKFKLIALIAVLHTTNAGAESIQFQCGGMSVYSYYAAEGMVPDKQAGWSNDAISNGEMVIDLDGDTGEVEYRYKDATGKWYSPSNEGGDVVLLTMDDTDLSFQILAMFPAGNTVEILTITEFDGETAKLIYANSRNTSMSANSKLMVGDCTVH